MAGSIDMDPDLLAEIQAQLTAIGGDFNTLAEDFVAKMEALSEAYGGDEVGGLILGIHQEVLTAFQQCIQDAGADIDVVGTMLGEVGTITRELDDEVAGIFNELLGELGA
ncbi:hypothetical protein [Glycomyces tritici]|uniref:Uncharacterized protein n=1 Tax=Glycomyces tritici TaxID=2665176 RepID=A0ABT7YRB1_9ACTN|nr:hypothetical protein [Glycomyces tritici]MDN3241133.1 hypothetical protein [Glycomyces tritici]